ncbi:MAG: O-antigen ligase family protein [bacterium]
MSKLLLVLIGLTPLLVTPQTYELFEFPKMIFVYLTASILLGHLLWKQATRKDNNLTIWQFSHVRLLWPVGLYALTFLISFTFSQNHSVSFYGYYTRFNGGLLSLAAYLTTFVFVYRNMNTEKKINALMKVILLASVPVSLYAVGQHFGIDAEYWVQNVKLRVFSTLGQPNWLAGYLLVVMPVTVWLFLYKSYKSYATYAAIVLFGLQFTAFWFTYSLSGLLGFAVLTPAFILLNKKLVQKNPKKLALLAGVCLSVAILFPGPLGARIKEFKNVAQNKMAAYAAEEVLPATGGDTGTIRLLVWQGSLKLWLSSPKVFLIGAGPETFAFSFLKFRLEGLNYTSEWDFLYNKAHNEYLNLLATQGILGLSAYLGMIYWGFKKARSAFEKALVAGIIGMSVSLFFGFHTVVTSLYLWVYLGVLYANAKLKT